MSLLLQTMHYKNFLVKHQQKLNQQKLNQQKLNQQKLNKQKRKKNKKTTSQPSVNLNSYVIPTNTTGVNYTTSMYNQVNDNLDYLLSCCTTIYSKYGNQQFMGSGSFIGSNVILTAGHVVINSNRTQLASPVYVTNPKTNEYMTVSNIYIDNVADIAILYISKNVDNYLSLASNNALIGDTVYLCGNPLALDELSVSKGIVRDNEYKDPTGTLLQNCLLLDNAGYSGNSGSPIVNSTNQIVGIYTFGFQGTEQLGGGSNLDVLKISINYLLTNKTNYISKNYIGLGYTIPTPFQLSAIYNNTLFSNEGVLINYIDSNSPFKGVLNINDIVLTINGKKLGSLINQTNFSPYIYGNNNQTIAITYFSYKNKTIQSANVLLNKTYQNVAVAIDTPFNPIDLEINPDKVNNFIIKK